MKMSSGSGALSWTGRAGGFSGPPLSAGDLLFVAACLAGGLVAAAAGWVVGLPSLRLRGDYLAIVTLGFGEIVRVVLQGTSEQVRRGQGVGLVAGDATPIAQADATLKAVFPLYFQLGAAGNGGRAKLAINLILGLNRLALAEGLVFAERMGLEPAAFLDVARKAASYSQVMDTKGGKMVRGDFAPEGRARRGAIFAGLGVDPLLTAAMFVVAFAGPETAPAEAFEQANIDRILAMG